MEKGSARSMVLGVVPPAFPSVFASVLIVFIEYFLPLIGRVFLHPEIVLLVIGRLIILISLNKGLSHHFSVTSLPPNAAALHFPAEQGIPQLDMHGGAFLLLKLLPFLIVIDLLPDHFLLTVL